MAGTGGGKEKKEFCRALCLSLQGKCQQLIIIPLANGKLEGFCVLQTIKQKQVPSSDTEVLVCFLAHMVGISGPVNLPTSYYLPFALISQGIYEVYFIREVVEYSINNPIYTA